MKIVCRSGNEYNLKMKFRSYQALQKAVRSKTKGTQKHARVLQAMEKVKDGGPKPDEAQLELAEEVIFGLQDELEDIVLPFLSEALQASGVDIDEIDEPEDVADMVNRLLGQEVPGAPNPLAATPDSTPSG